MKVATHPQRAAPLRTRPRFLDRDILGMSMGDLVGWHQGASHWQSNQEVTAFGLTYSMAVLGATLEAKTGTGRSQFFCGLANGIASTRRDPKRAARNVVEGLLNVMAAKGLDKLRLIQVISHIKEAMGWVSRLLDARDVLGIATDPNAPANEGVQAVTDLVAPKGYYDLGRGIAELIGLPVLNALGISTWLCTNRPVLVPSGTGTGGTP